MVSRDTLWDALAITSGSWARRTSRYLLAQAVHYIPPPSQASVTWAANG